MNLTLTTPPAEEPVSLAVAKVHMDVDYTDHDAYISSLIATVSAHMDARDGVLGRCMVTQTWTMKLDDFPRGERPIYLPFAPTQSITSVKYYDADNALQTWDASNYEFETGDFDPCIHVADSSSYPTTRTRRGAVVIEFVAGYGSASDVPAPLKQAILLMVSELYERREMAVMATYVPTRTIDSLIAPYRRNRVA